MTRFWPELASLQRQLASTRRVGYGTKVENLRKPGDDPNLTATALQTGRWKLGKPPSRLRQRCAVRWLRAPLCMPELSQFAFWRQWRSGEHRKAPFFPAPPYAIAQIGFNPYQQCGHVDLIYSHDRSV